MIGLLLCPFYLAMHLPLPLPQGIIATETDLDRRVECQAHARDRPPLDSG